MNWLVGPWVRRRPLRPGLRAAVTPAGVTARVPSTQPSDCGAQFVLTEADFCRLIDARRREHARPQSDDTCPD